MQIVYTPKIDFSWVNFNSQFSDVRKTRYFKLDVTAEFYAVAVAVNLATDGAMHLTSLSVCKMNSSCS